VGDGLKVDASRKNNRKNQFVGFPLGWGSSLGNNGECHESRGITQLIYKERKTRSGLRTVD